MIEKLFYRKLYGEPSSQRTRNEIDDLESYLSRYTPENREGFSVGKDGGGIKYVLKTGALISLSVQGNFSIVTVQTNVKSNGLFKKLRDVYTEINLSHYD